MLTTSGWGYENMPAICSDASCCGGNCVGICAYGIQLTNSCGGNAGGSYSRLCPCGNEAEVTTTLSCNQQLTGASSISMGMGSVKFSWEGFTIENPANTVVILFEV
jgi:hypothetical protein